MKQASKEGGTNASQLITDLIAKLGDWRGEVPGKEKWPSFFAGHKETTNDCREHRLPVPSVRFAEFQRAFGLGGEPPQRK
jgi:hypothetical protein